MAKKKTEDITEDVTLETAEVTEGVNAAIVAEETVEEYTAYAYVGPSIPKTSLRSKMVLRGTLADIKQFYKAEMEAYPQIEQLLVPVHKLAVYARRATTPGNITNKYYSDLASAIRSRKEE